MNQLNRRRFFEDSLLAAAAAASVGAVPALAAEKKKTEANDKIGIAVIGVRGRGSDHIQAFQARGDCQVLIACDADKDVGQKVADKFKCKFVQDMRRAFDDPAVDVVSIATPNHWHALAAIWAMQAGKDVYVEKPCSHNVSEGRRMIQAARKHNRICQVGTQRRSDLGKAEAVRFMAEGNMGKITLARSVMNRRRNSIGPKVQGAIPPGVDYNLFAGPAPMAPVTRKTFHYDWHWFWDFGNGEIGNNDIHMIDLVAWGLGLMQLPRASMCYGGRLGFNDAAETANTQVAIHDYGDLTVVQEVRNLDTKSGFAPSGGMFNSSEGYMTFGDPGAKFFDKKGKLVREFKGPVESHFDNFIETVRSRKLENLHADIAKAHVPAGLCHLANISYRLGREASTKEIGRQLESRKINDNAADTLERTRQHLVANGIDLDKTPLTLGPWLEFDPKKEQFIGRSDADRLLTREYREPFVVPKQI